MKIDINKGDKSKMKNISSIIIAIVVIISVITGAVKMNNSQSVKDIELVIGQTTLSEYEEYYPNPDMGTQSFGWRVHHTSTDGTKYSLSFYFNEEGDDFVLKKIMIWDDNEGMYVDFKTQ